MTKIIPVDFETEGIEKRPVYPPKPVGVAIDKKYYAWGHPSNNNCTKSQARRALLDVYRNSIPVFHNAAFDIMVGMEHLDLPYPPIDFHDTLFLAYLYDPRAKSLSLKPLAEEHLGIPANAQAKLNNWILEHVFEAYGKKPTKQDPLGAHIAEAPGDLVGKYAVADGRMTLGLFKFFYPIIKELGMEAAYEREKANLPIFEGMSSTGLKVRAGKLRKDLKVWKSNREQWATWIRKRLKTPDLDIASPKQLANAMDKTGKVHEGDWIMTKPSKTYPDGQRSTKRENLIKVCNDKKLVEKLALYGVMSTYIGTFAEPWLATASAHNGRVYPSFNQVRSTDEHGRTRGTRTGRPSSNNPNFLNVPRNQKDPLLPNLRDYIAPDDGCMFLIRDYSQQELRILAHFEGGALFEAYLENPRMDVHDFVGNLIHETTGVKLPRSTVKVINFGIVYGMGAPGLMLKLNVSDQEAKDLKDYHAKALPGVKDLGNRITKHCKRGNPIYTWGGREYYVEEPTVIEGKRREFYYKQLNCLIQGSAACCTKEAMIRVNKVLKPLGGRIALQVYDELDSMVPKEVYKEAMALQKREMESIEFDIPMLSDGKIGRKSWGEAIKYEDPE